MTHCVFIIYTHHSKPCYQKHHAILTSDLLNFGSCNNCCSISSSSSLFWRGSVMPRSSPVTSHMEPADSDCSICVLMATLFLMSLNSDFISARSEMMSLFAENCKIKTIFTIYYYQFFYTLKSLQMYLTGIKASKNKFKRVQWCLDLVFN